jgi:ribosomal protein S18 acetylase RimI-like enzyme
LKPEIGNRPVYKPAQAGQMDAFLEQMRAEMEPYFQQASQALGMDWEQFAGLFKTRGQVFGIYDADELAGYYWIEARDEILHLHALILGEAYQGKGMGTATLNHLVEEYRGALKAIELGVHKANERAKSLYEHFGFETVERMEDVGFTIMRKDLVG